MQFSLSQPTTDYRPPATAKKWLFLCPLLFALLLANTVTRSDDDTDHLDLTFGSAGKTLTDFTGGADVANALAMLPDGRLLVAGSAVNTATADTDFGLARYHQNGTLDRSFGSGGKVITDVGGLGDIINAVALQSDGKIVVAGQSFTATNFDLSLARYHADGTLDDSFGTGGIVLTDIIGNEDIAFALVILPDGKIVAAGHTSDDVQDLDFALVRYNSDGSLDPTFGSGGTVTTDLLGSDDQAFALARQADGRLIAGGAAIDPEKGVSHFALARYNPDGALDMTFQTGKVITTYPGPSSLQALTVSTDGKIVAAGSTLQSGGGDFIKAAAPDPGSASNDFALARYNYDGTLDGTFGQGGRVTTDFFGEDDQSYDVAIQADGKIVAAGAAIVGHREESAAPTMAQFFRPSDHVAEPTDFAVARYNLDGSLDQTFGDAGKVATELAPDVNLAAAVVIQSDGRIVAAGRAGDANHPDFGMVRYALITFDVCLQDDRTGRLFRFNSVTGDYRAQDCAKGSVLSGRGVITRSGCKLYLRDSGADPKRPDRNVSVLVNTCSGTGSATAQTFSPSSVITINDSRITDSSCHCPGAVARAVVGSR